MKQGLLILVILLVSCISMPQSIEPQINKSFNLHVDNTQIEVEDNKVDTKDNPSDVIVDIDIPIKRVKEGQLVSFPNLVAQDPDGDKIYYTFQTPLSVDGTWQTGPGDAGTYETVIIASDGNTYTRQPIRIIVESINAPPQILGLNDVKTREGETINLNYKIIDTDKDDVKVHIEGWKEEFPYTTTYSDAGVHSIKVIANDGTNTVERVVTISIEDVNRPPVLHEYDGIEVLEGDLVRVLADAEDSDGDKLSFTYGNPLNATGQWQTKEGDQGVYKAKITVSDGSLSDSTVLRIAVLRYNAAPLIKSLPDITVKEGEEVVVDVEAVDPEGDEVEIKWSGWMKSNKKVTNFLDQGTHLVTVTASDGVLEANETFTVTVIDVNRPPVFLPGAFD